MKYNLVDLDTALVSIEEAMFSVGLKIENFHAVLDAYQEPHRFYHNLDHLRDLGNKILGLKDVLYEEMELLWIAAAYHDFVYDPMNSNGLNEDLSIKRFERDLCKCSSNISAEKRNQVKEIIQGTAKRTKPESKLARIFWNFDNQILTESFDVLLDYEKKIFLEYQCFNYSQYGPRRSEFLRSEFERTENLDLLALSKYVKYRKPKVGIYPGSFNPFHKGHLNILNKAERIFDKIILVKANNPEKDNYEASEIPTEIKNREIIEWDGLTTDLITKLSDQCEITLIRGLRNGKDLDYEVNQLRFMEEMKPDLNVCLIQCDKEFEHISSSAIRNIRKFSQEEAKKYLI